MYGGGFGGGGGGKGGNDTPSDNLYVAGLPIGIDDGSVKQVFGGYGVVTQCKVLPGRPGAQDCVALIRFQSVQEAMTVKEMLNGNIPEGLSQPLSIKFKAGGDGGGSKGGDKGGGKKAGQTTVDWETPSDNLYVMGLPIEIDDSLVHQIFGAYGTIAQCKVMEPRAGANDKVALIRYTSLQEAATVKETLNGTVPQGLYTPVTVKYKAGPVSGKDGGKGNDMHSPAGGGMYGEEADPSENLYVKGLPFGIDENTVTQVFSTYGQVTQCKVLTTMPGQTDCAALIRFASVEVAQWIKENLNGNIPEGFEGPVSIKFKADKGAGKGAPSKGYAGKGSMMAPPGGAPGGGEEEPGDNLFVTGLPIGVDENSVKEVFMLYGSVVSIKVLPARGNDCAALIRYQSATEAQWVKENLDGNIPQGMTGPVGIKYKSGGGGKGGDGKGAPGGWGPADNSGGKGAYGSSPYGDGGKGGGKGGGASHSMVGKVIASGFEDSGGLPCGTGVGVSDNGTLYIAGLPHDIEELDLYKIFSPFGAIKPKGVKLVVNPDGSCKGFGFVNFIEEAHAQQAISICDQAQLPDGTILKVSIKSGGNSASKWGGAGGAAEWGQAAQAAEPGW